MAKTLPLLAAASIVAACLVVAVIVAPGRTGTDGRGDTEAADPARTAGQQSTWFRSLFASSDFECARAPDQPGDRRKDTSRLRVCAYNVEWLFNGDGKPASIPIKTPEQAEHHVQDLAGVLKELDCDVVSMSEVQNCDMTFRLADATGDASYRGYLVKGTDTSTQQNTALLTRVDPVVDLTRTDARQDYPVAGNNCGSTSSSGSTGVSKHYTTRLQVGTTAITLVGAHLLAFPTQTDRCLKREAQALVLRGLVDEALARGDEVIVLGDLNDYSDSFLDVANDVPTSRTLRFLREGNGGASSAFPPLFEVGTVPPHDLRYTSEYNGGLLSQIDHVLISEGLKGRLQSVSNAHLYPEGTISDHWPVVIDISTA